MSETEETDESESVRKSPSVDWASDGAESGLRLTADAGVGFADLARRSHLHQTHSHSTQTPRWTLGLPLLLTGHVWWRRELEDGMKEEPS